MIEHLIELAGLALFAAILARLFWMATRPVSPLERYSRELAADHKRRNRRDAKEALR